MADGRRSELVIGFASIVRVRCDEATQALGLDGLVGEVFGFTTPSSTGVEVVGDVGDDFAVNVYFNDLQRDYWFAEHLVEMVEQGAGATVKLDGVQGGWRKQDDGSWIEMKSSESGKITSSDHKSAWWKFWK